MFKVMVYCKQDKQLDVFECNSINIDNEKEKACFTFMNNGCIEHKWYEFKSYNVAYDANDYFRFWGGNLVSDRYK